MPQRSHIQVPFGGGLDRETGQMAVKPTSMQDLRNVILHKGKAVAREGAASTLTFNDTNGDACTDILAGQTILGFRTAAIVAYQGDDTKAKAGEVSIHLMDAGATTQRLLGEWFTVSDPANEDPPIVLTAESYGRVFFAHDEYRVSRRAATFVYDPFQGSELQALKVGKTWPGYPTNEDDEPKADPADSEVPNIKFRGVYSYLNYLWGWGFGTSQDDRPEMVRVSLPGQPKTFLPEWYFIVGARFDPTIALAQAGNVLKVFKEVETYDIEGHSAETFGEVPADEHFGCMAPRLSVSVNGVTFFWSDMGPRIATGGGPSQEIGLPLDLEGFEPSDLPTREEIERGWANYIPEARVVVFAFNRRLYTLTLREGTPAAWSYWTLGFDQMSGFQIYNTGIGASGTTAPTGTPEWETYGHSLQEGYITCHWDNVGQDGDELVEMWARKHRQLVSSWRMDNDADDDGVVDDFTSQVGADVTAAFTASEGDDGYQQIEITGSTGADEALVKQESDDVAAGDVVNLSFEFLASGLTGGCEGFLRMRFLDGGGAELGVEELFGITLTNEFERRYLLEKTAPANTASVEFQAGIRTQASGETGTIQVRYALLNNTGESGSWKRWRSVQVEADVDQNERLWGGSPDDPLEGGSTYEIALRYRRGVNFGSGFTSDNPDNWPDAVKGVGVTGLITLELFTDQMVWVDEADADGYVYDYPEWYVPDSSGTEGVGHFILITKKLKQWVQDRVDEGNAFGSGIRIYRDTGGGFSLLTTLTSNYILDALEDDSLFYPELDAFIPDQNKDLINPDPPLDSDVLGGLLETDTSVGGEVDASYYLVLYDGTEVAGTQSDTATRWVGPPKMAGVAAYGNTNNPQDLTAEWEPGYRAGYYPLVSLLNLVDAQVIDEYQVQYKNVTTDGAWTDFGGSPYPGPHSGSGDFGTTTATEQALTSGDDYKVRVRIQYELFGVRHLTPYLESNVVTVP